MADKIQVDLDQDTKCIDVPKAVALCPYCNAQMFVLATGWTEEEEGKPWTVSSIETSCESEPDIDSDAWDEWGDHHFYMPYVYLLPVCKKIEKWLNDNYEFTHKGNSDKVLQTADNSPA